MRHANVTRAMYDTETGSDDTTLGDGHQDLRVSFRETLDDVVGLGTFLWWCVRTYLASEWSPSFSEASFVHCRCHMAKFFL